MSNWNINERICQLLEDYWGTGGRKLQNDENESFVLMILECNNCDSSQLYMSGAWGLYMCINGGGVV